ncbi:MAG: hypothetical protein ACLT32_03245, partial [Ruminococcus bicirculans (ex Wegman et al. 2014)]|uniref:hypothetical protein n=1 Tax=Ruminococcus bicirculans (ex Wegman et al. 2014) TaxID=1160721 RepID=UPI003994A561
INSFFCFLHAAHSHPLNPNLSFIPNLYNFTYKNNMWLPASIEIGIYFWHGSIILLNSVVISSLEN